MAPPRQSTISLDKPDLKKSLWRLLSFYKYFVSTYTCTFIYIKMLEVEINEK